MNISDVKIRQQFVHKVLSALRSEGISAEIHHVEFELHRCIPQCGNENLNLKEATLRSPVHVQLVDPVLLERKILQNIKALQSVGNARVSQRPHVADNGGHMHIPYEERVITSTKTASESMYKSRPVFRD